LQFPSQAEGIICTLGSALCTTSICQSSPQTSSGLTSEQPQPVSTSPCGTSGHFVM
jgi:hypothetical protein